MPRLAERRVARFTTLGGMVLAAETLLGHLVERGGTRQPGDLALATLAGYALGQWLPFRPVRAESAHAARS